MTYSRSDLALVMLRLGVGLAFVAHGWPKIEHPTTWAAHEFPATPPIAGAIVAAIEFGGGLAVLAGFATRIAAFLLAADMVVVIFFVLVPRGAAYVSETAGASTFELPLIYLAVAFALLMIGPGALSIDGFRASRSGPGRRPSGRSGRGKAR